MSKYKKTLRKSYGGSLIVIGFILSPLSWWNDLIINIPLSYLFALPFAAFNRSFFLPSFITGYWISNILGLILIHNGTKKIITKKESTKDFKKELIKMLIWSTFYTILIVILVLIGIIKFPTEYLPK